MTQMILELSEEAAEAWAERAEREGYPSAAEAVAAALEYEVEPIDPANVELLRERFAGDPANDVPYIEGLQRIAAKHGLTLDAPTEDAAL